MADVFISYSDKSPKAAEAIADALDRAGISYWLARRHMKIGQNFSEVIPKEIQKCKVFLLILDKNSNQSEHVLSEINLAFNRKNNQEAIEFLIFKTDNCVVSDKVRYYINHFQIMNGNPPNAQRVSALIYCIADILLMEPPPIPPPSKWRLPIICALLLIMTFISVAVWQTWKSDLDKPTTNDEQAQELESKQGQAQKMDIKWTLENGVLTISGNGEMEDYAYVNGRFGLIITCPWYRERELITSIVIEDGVTSIGAGAFIGCDHLTSVIIPDSVTSIRELAFDDCGSLTNISVPAETYIENSAFSEWTTVTRRQNRPTWMLENGILTIYGHGDMEDYETFGSPWYGEIITSVVIKDGVTSIGNNAFFDCGGMRSVALPNSLISIGEGAFFACVSLTSVVLPDSITSIGEGAFGDCDNLASVVLSNNMTKIADALFESCTNLTDVVIPDGVTNIGEGAFFACRSLTSILFPDSVISIGAYAFQRCDSLTNVTFSKNLTYIGDNAFEKCDCLTSVYIPDSTYSICKEAFAYCKSLTNVSIPANASMGHSVFPEWTDVERRERKQTTWRRARG